jgi:hypothetical protein
MDVINLSILILYPLQAQTMYFRGLFPEIPKRVGLNFEFRTLRGLFWSFPIL